MCDAAVGQAPLDLTFPADTGQLGPVRTSLRQWLAQCAPGTATAQDVLVAVGEAVANAVEHGHREIRGEARLKAWLSDGSLHLVVSDTGQWRPPAPEPAPYRGNGIMLMRELMDNVSIVPGPAGTIVTMDVRIAPAA